MLCRTILLAVLLCVATTAPSQEPPGERTGAADLQWFDDVDAAQREAAASGRLVLAVLSDASVSASAAEDPSRARVQHLISSSEALRTLVSDSCVLLAQRCGPPSVLVGSRRASGNRLFLGILDDQLRCYRLALGLPDDRWLARALNDAVLQRLMLAGVDTPAARAEILVTRAMERLEPAWRAQVGGKQGALAQSADAGGADADAAGWRTQASLHWQHLSSFLIADLATRFGMGGDAADLQRLRSLSQHAEMSAPMADAVLAIAPAAPWPQLSRTLAESLWPEGYWRVPDPDSPLVQQIEQVVQGGQSVVLDIQDARLDALAGRTSAFFAQPADVGEQRQLSEVLESFDVRTVDLRQLAGLALHGDWPSTDFVQPSPVRYVVLVSDQPPLVIRDREHETRVRKKLESIARRMKNQKRKN